MRWSGVFLTALLLWPAARVAGQELECQCRIVPVNVIDREGNQVWGLTPADFRGEFRGQPVKILSVTLDSGPRRVVIVLDASPSMIQGEKWDLARRLALDLAVRGPDNFSLGLVVFRRQMIRVVELEGGRQAVQEAVNALTADAEIVSHSAPGSALLDGLTAGLERFGTPQFGDALYVVTDGDEYSSRMSEKQVGEGLLRSGARMFVVLFRAVASQRDFPEFHVGPNILYALTGLSRGLLHEIPDPTRPFRLQSTIRQEEEASLAAVAKTFCQRMANVYRLDIELPRGLDKPSGW